MNFLLNTFCFDQIRMQEEYMKWLIQEASSCLTESSEIDEPKLRQIVQKCLPFIIDPGFSALWVVLLDRIASLSRLMDTSDIYSDLNKTVVPQMLTGEGPPVQVLTQLWLTHLPSLEVMVVSLIQVLTLGDSGLSEQVLEKSSLVQAVRREPALHYSVQGMLRSLQQLTELAPVVARVREAMTEGEVGIPSP